MNIQLNRQIAIDGFIVTEGAGLQAVCQKKRMPVGFISNPHITKANEKRTVHSKGTIIFMLPIRAVRLRMAVQAK